MGLGGAPGAAFQMEIPEFCRSRAGACAVRRISGRKPPHFLEPDVLPRSGARLRCALYRPSITRGPENGGSLF